ncbi:hypothetical protein [Serratia symbiotica]|uniref:hypothetical protein n=1 Tax=Serratia symbiotica TaxID=138074 RepID=UPI001322A569|nr:hypothetical protein [Serratia symbiotica]QTP13371.1 hypothetical protein GPZ83_0000080 [Serratia symbiotica]
MLFSDIKNELTLNTAREMLVLNKVEIYASLLNYLELSLLQQGFVIQQGTIAEGEVINHLELEFTFSLLFQHYLRLTGISYGDSWPKSRVLQARAFACEFLAKLEQLDFVIVRQSTYSFYFDDVADVEAALIAQLKEAMDGGDVGGSGMVLKP